MSFFFSPPPFLSYLHSHDGRLVPWRFLLMNVFKSSFSHHVSSLSSSSSFILSWQGEIMKDLHLGEKRKERKKGGEGPLFPIPSLFGCLYVFVSFDFL